MKYRLTKVIDKHYPRHDYTNFQLVEEDGVKENGNGYNLKKKRHPLGRMKFHANYDISREFRKYTNTDLFIPAPKSLIEKLRLQAAKEASPAPEKEDEEEEEVLCLDNPVNTDNFLASQETPGVEKATDSEKTAEITGGVVGTTEIHQPEEFDDFFGHGPEDQCVEVGLDKVPCQRAESSDSDTSDDETTLVPEQGCSPNAACDEVQEGTALTSAVCPESGNTDAAKKDETLCKSVVMTNTEATELKNPEFEVPTESVSAANTEANPDTNKMTEMNSSSSQEKKVVTQTDPRAESGKETESQTVLQAEEKTDKQTDSEPEKQEVKRVEHTVSLPMAEKDSSTEDETSAVKMSSDTESVKSIIRQASVEKSGDKSPEKSVKFSKLK